MTLCRHRIWWRHHYQTTATDDITITTANTAAQVFTTLDAGAATTGAISITATGSGALTVTNAVVASAGTLTLDGSGASMRLR